MIDQRDLTADAELDRRIVTIFLAQARADHALIEGDGPLRFVGMSPEQTRLVIEGLIIRTRAKRQARSYSAG